MAVIQPFVIALEWVFDNVLNAPLMSGRTDAERRLVAEQKQFIWHQINAIVGEEKAGVNAWPTTAARPMPISEADKREVSQARNEGHLVYFPLNVPPGDLKISFTDDPSGYVKVSGVAETSPLAENLQVGDVVLFIGGESTVHFECSALVERLEELTRDGLHVSIVVAPSCMDTQRELVLQAHDEYIDAPHDHVTQLACGACMDTHQELVSQAHDKHIDAPRAHATQLACGAPSSPDAEGEAPPPPPKMQRLPTVDAHELPDPRDRDRFDLFCAQVSAHFCINLLKRHAELDEAVITLSRLLANPPTDRKSHGNIKSRLATVHAIKAKSLKRWGMDKLGDEVTEERLERAVRKKVRRDVAIAFHWDQELAQLNGDAVELKMLEFARFERGSTMPTLLSPPPPPPPPPPSQI